MMLENGDIHSQKFLNIGSSIEFLPAQGNYRDHNIVNKLNYDNWKRIGLMDKIF